MEGWMSPFGHLVFNLSDDAAPVFQLPATSGFLWLRNKIRIVSFCEILYYLLWMHSTSLKLTFNSEMENTV